LEISGRDSDIWARVEYRIKEEDAARVKVAILERRPLWVAGAEFALRVFAYHGIAE